MPGRRSQRTAEGTRRQAGPPEASAIRTKGEPALAELLGAAVSASGNVERATHGFHSYPAGMHPDTARALIEACPGAVHDPFCGGGTVLVEALLAGRAASGTDISPVAILVSRARTADPSLATPMRSAARKLADQARLRVDVEIPEVAAGWYEPHVAQELGRLRDGIAEIEGPEQALLRAVLSSIVVKASFRESDTSNRRQTSHRPPGTTAILFHKKARELGRMLEELPAGGPPARARRGDARLEPPPEGTGLVLTSPPYPGVYDYVPMQQLRHAWLGIDPGAAVAAELGSRRSFRAKGRSEALKRWRDATDAWVAAQAQGLAEGARLAVVIGDGLVGGKVVDTLAVTVDAMRAAGLQVLARASADRPDRARETIRTEHLVLGEKRGA